MEALGQYIVRLIYVSAFLLLLTDCASLPPQPSDFLGLTQARLAAKIGFPLRVYTLPATAKGGPGVLFWVYYQKTPSGGVEEKQFSFDGGPLKVSSVSSDIVPSRLLSLERPDDFQLIYKYNAAHDR